MMDSFARIEERRLAIAELNSIMSHLGTRYGNNPPIEILKEFTELIRAYKVKYGYGSPFEKRKDGLELKSFCIKNGLALT